MVVLRAAPAIYLRRSFVLLAVLGALTVMVFVVGVWSGEARGLPIGEAWRGGLTRLTGGRLTLSRVDAGVLGVLAVFLVRRARLDWLTIRPGPVEVRPLEGLPLAGLNDEQGWRLNVEFREELAGSQLYETTSVPGDLETERIIEVFREAPGGERLALFGAVWSFLWPSRAFVVTATLRTREQAPSAGVSVTVRRLPRPGVELDTQWGDDLEDALRKAAFAVTAHIVPQTRACDRPPWGQWRERSNDKVMPTDLMMHYQVAKRMVADRRYDEALSQYHHALVHDTDNVYLRYDVGQIFERLHLYPDAVRVYAQLTNRLFPLADPEDGRRGRQVAYDRPTLYEDPFMVRYRYVGALTTGSRLASELLTPDWDVLREWLVIDQIARTDPDHPRARDRHLRPWRSTELADLRAWLSAHYDQAWRSQLPREIALYRGGLTGVLVDDPNLAARPGFLEHGRLPDGWWGLSAQDMRLRAVEEFFLYVAGYEVDSLLRDFRRHSARGGWRRRNTPLTVVALQMLDLLICYRKKRFRPMGAFPEAHPQTWPPGLENMRQNLADAGYRGDSPNWLEHYVAACFYALPLQDDQAPRRHHQPMAEAAVRALDRAQECGDDIDFVTSKRYWLLAGDPDLVGLRQYECFRAFEGRVYLHPQPISKNPAKYELFHYMRLGLAQGAAWMEDLWRERAALDATALSAKELENWFRQERRAWEVLVRLGRFHRQWQTRSAGLDALRKLGRYAGAAPSPVTYPEVVLDYFNVGTGMPEHSGKRIAGMQELFDFLAVELGPAASIDPETSVPEVPADLIESETPDEQEQPTEGPDRPQAPVIPNTRAWIWHAEHCSRAVPGAGFPLPPGEMLDLCTARAAVWAALRQRVTTPARRTNEGFIEAVRRLPVPQTPVDRMLIDLDGRQARVLDEKSRS